MKILYAKRRIICKPTLPWLYRADEGGMWFGKLYIYAPRIFKPREPAQAGDTREDKW